MEYKYELIQIKYMHVISNHELHEKIKILEEKFNNKPANGVLYRRYLYVFEELEKLKAWRNKINGALIIINVILLPLIIGFFIEYIFN